MKNIIKNPFAKRKGTVTMLCIVCTVFFIAMLLANGCNEKAEQKKMDEETFNKNLESVPFVSVPKEDLPEWLNEKIDRLIEDYVGKPHPLRGMEKQASVYRGEWKKQKVYLIQSIYSSCPCCFLDENGEPISFTPPITTSNNNDLENLLPESTNWEVIFQIIQGKIVEET